MSFIWHMLRFKGLKVEWLQKMWKKWGGGRFYSHPGQTVCEAEAAGYHLQEVQS